MERKTREEEEGEGKSTHQGVHSLPLGDHSSFSSLSVYKMRMAWPLTMAVASLVSLSDLGFL